MKIELFDFQQNAVDNIIEELYYGQREVIDNPERHQAICLSAPTGAGKTVIMTAVIEAMLAGDRFGFTDDGPAVLWVTDSPELNEQTRFRLISHLDTSWNDRVETVESSFDMPSLPRGVWFLNTQKLGKKGMLGKPGDRRSHTFWQTIGTTVKERPGDLVLIIDEAHRGMSLSNRERKESQSIVQRFIRGYQLSYAEHNSDLYLPAIPLLVGVSATPKRFHDLIDDVEPKRQKRDVVVSNEDVRRSGLLKQTIRLRHVDTGTGAEYTLLHGALKQYEQFSKTWQQHTSNSTTRVKPVMLIQVRDGDKGSRSETDLDEVVSAVRSTLGTSLHNRGIAHAFQEPAGPFNAAGLQIRHLRPSQINEDEHVQVILFKTALSTGWDCPRAEVMVSFRPATDETAIAQLVGRMVRAPLRRTIPDNELLNGVDLYLPHFDSKALDRVIDRLRNDTSEESTGARVYVARDLSINPALKNHIDDIRQAVSDMATYEPASMRRITEVTRLANIARCLERTSSGALPVLKDASEIARKHLVDKIIAIHRGKTTDPDWQDATKKILTVTVRTETIKTQSETQSTGHTQEATTESRPISDQDLDRLFEALNAKIGNGLMRQSLTKLQDHDTRSEARRMLQAELLALFQGKELEYLKVPEDIQKQAKDLIQEWQAKPEYKLAIEALPDQERARLDKLFAEPGNAIRQRTGSGSLLPKVINARKPRSDAPEFERHIYTEGDNTRVQLGLNGWEQQAIQEHLEDTNVVAWLRNERASGRWRLAIPYRKYDNDGLMYPDLVLFRRDKSTDSMKVDVVDPHSLHLSDSLEKLQALARYADEHRGGGTLGRVVVVAEIDDALSMQDLSDPQISKKALDCRDHSDLRHFLLSHETASQKRRRLSKSSYQPSLEGDDRDDAPRRQLDKHKRNRSHPHLHSYPRSER